jgi:hypothetical protein
MTRPNHPHVLAYKPQSTKPATTNPKTKETLEPMQVQEFPMSCEITSLRGQDLNLRPLGYEPSELPNCSTPRRDSRLPRSRGLSADGQLARGDHDIHEGTVAPGSTGLPAAHPRICGPVSPSAQRERSAPRTQPSAARAWAATGQPPPTLVAYFVGAYFVAAIARLIASSIFASACAAATRSLAAYAACRAVRAVW